MLALIWRALLPECQWTDVHYTALWLPFPMTTHCRHQ